MRYRIYFKYSDSSTPYNSFKMNKYSLLPDILSKFVSKIAGWVANSVDPDEWIYTVFSGLSVRIHSVNTVDISKDGNGDKP